MNILLINHYAGSNYHGMEYRPYYLAREWVEMGHEVSIVASSFSHLRVYQPQVDRPVTEEVIDGIRYWWLKAPGYGGNGTLRIINIFSFLNMLIKYEKRLRSGRPDVVIASSTYPLDVIPARRIARRCGARLIYEVHDLWPLSPIELGGMSPWHPFIMLLQWAENLAYREADRVVSVLPKADDHMLRHGMAPHKFAYIPNGTDVAEWQADATPPPAEHCRYLGRLRQDGQFVVGYAGAHGIANALHYLVGAAELLRDHSVAFVLVGQGAEKEPLRRRAERLGLANVHLLPAVAKPHIPALLAAMDTLYIGWSKRPIYRFGISPNKLLDYMMAAKPVIHAIEAGNDPVAESNCGISIAPEDPQALADAVLRLMRLPAAEREALGSRGRDYVLQHHDYRVLAARFLEIMQ